MWIVLIIILMVVIVVFIAAQEDPASNRIGDSKYPQLTPRQQRRFSEIPDKLRDPLSFFEANNMTDLVFVNLGKESVFRTEESLEKIPCDDLRTIDEWWVRYSQGKHGFSVQRQIYYDLGGTKEYNREIMLKFCGRIGWRDDKIGWYMDVQFKVVNSQIYDGPSRLSKNKVLAPVISKSLPLKNVDPNFYFLGVPSGFFPDFLDPCWTDSNNIDQGLKVLHTFLVHKLEKCNI